jgi:hypothetical protein
MADDLAQMKTRITSELGGRSDLADQIAYAINDAIKVYQKERFRFNESVPSSPITFPTVAGQANYGTVANANIGTLFDIDYVIVQQGNELYTLQPDDAARLRVYNQVNTMSGTPMWYAYEGNELILSPVPSEVLTVTLGLFRRVAAPASDDEASNPWMVDAERLIRARAKFEIATHVTRNLTLAQQMSPEPPERNGGIVGAAYREWKSLKGEANRVTSQKRVRAMKF